jgi:hypothetical protein
VVHGLTAGLHGFISQLVTAVLTCDQTSTVVSKNDYVQLVPHHKTLQRFSLLLLVRLSQLTEVKK